MKSLTLFGKRHLSVLLILLVTGCAITPVRVSQKELPLAVGSEPLIRARLGKVQIEPFRQSVIKRDKFYHHISGTTTSEYIIRQVEPRFREAFQLFLKSSGLFERSSKYSINVSAEFLSMKLYMPSIL